MDLGANIVGSGDGPDSLIRMTDELNIFHSDSFLLSKKKISVPKRESCASLKYREEITQVCSDLKKNVLSSLQNKSFPLVLGGDHSLALGSIFASQKYCHDKGLRLGVVWLDAHADMNTPESSESGNIHGMPLATVLGMGHQSLTDISDGAPYLKGENVALIGLRSVDKKEQIIMEESSVKSHTMEQARSVGLNNLSSLLKEKLIDQVDCLHFSFDLDVMDPDLAPSVSTPEDSGMSLEELAPLLKVIKDSGKLMAMDLVEYNPLYEKGGRGLLTVEQVLKNLFV